MKDLHVEAAETSFDFGAGITVTLSRKAAHTLATDIDRVLKLLAVEAPSPGMVVGSAMLTRLSSFHSELARVLNTG